jgi:hypothetical protein
MNLNDLFDSLVLWKFENLNFLWYKEMLYDTSDELASMVYRNEWSSSKYWPFEAISWSFHKQG